MVKGSFLRFVYSAVTSSEVDQASRGALARSTAAKEYTLKDRREAALRGVPTPMHEQTQVEAEHALQDVGVPPQMNAAQRARLVQMRKGAFQPFTALAQESLAPGPAEASRSDRPRRGPWSCRDHRVPKGRRARRPPQVHRSDCCACDQLAHGVSRWLHRLDLFRGRDECLDQGRRVPGIGRLHRPRRWPRCRDPPRVLWARCVRPSFLGDFRVGIVRCVRRLEPFLRRVRSRRAKSARVGVSIPEAWASFQERLIRVPRVAAHDTPQGRVGRARHRSSSAPCRRRPAAA